MWSKRLEILTQLNQIIDSFNNRKEVVLQTEDSDPKIIKGFCSKEILLSYVPIDLI